jgi:hypothetical protein
MARVSCTTGVNCLEQVAMRIAFPGLLLTVLGRGNLRVERCVSGVVFIVLGLTAAFVGNQRK